MHNEDNNLCYRAQFYALTRPELEKIIAKLSPEKNYFANQVALAILEEDEKKIVQLPIENAAKIINEKTITLQNIISNSNGHNNNTITLARLELLNRGKLIDKIEEPTNSSIFYLILIILIFAALTAVVLKMFNLV